MNKRIEKIASYIHLNDKVIDVGCDNALLGECLANKKIYSIASDIKENIILNAKKRIENLKLDKYINFIVTDGLKNTQTLNYDTIVLSGMGTYTILKILKDLLKKPKKIITISNNNYDILRVEMLKLGYVIELEEIIFDKGKYYNLILFIPGTSKYTESDILIGKNHLNESLLVEKLKLELKKYKIIYKKSKNEQILKKIDIIEKKLMCH